MKIRDRSEVYDRLVILADRVLNKSKACAKCPIGCVTLEPSRAWCCGGCPMLGPTGCTVKALGCKLHLCRSEGAKVSDHAWDRLERLKKIAVKYNMWYARANKEQSLNAPKDADFWYWYHKLNGPVARRRIAHEQEAANDGSDACCGNGCGKCGGEKPAVSRGWWSLHRWR